MRMQTTIPFKPVPRVLTPNMRLCVNEISAFYRGGLPGLIRLQHVVLSIFAHFGVKSVKDREFVLIKSGFDKTNEDFDELFKIGSK